jgi:hypothetical protein
VDGREDELKGKEMTDYSDLVKRLRVGTTTAIDNRGSTETVSTALEREAAAAINELSEELKARIEELKLSARIVNAQMANIHELENRIAELETALLREKV